MKPELLYFHKSTNIKDLLRDMEGRKIDYLKNDDGSSITDKEARANLAELQAKGHKLLPTSPDCEGFDPFLYGCKGHRTNRNRIDYENRLFRTVRDWQYLSERTKYSWFFNNCTGDFTLDFETNQQIDLMFLSRYQAKEWELNEVRQPDLLPTMPEELSPIPTELKTEILNLQ